MLAPFSFHVAFVRCTPLLACGCQGLFSGPYSIHCVTVTQCISPLCPRADPGLFPAWVVPELCCCEHSSMCPLWTHVGISVGSTWGWSFRSPLCCDSSSQAQVYPSLFTPLRPPELGISCLEYGSKCWGAGEQDQDGGLWEPQGGDPDSSHPRSPLSPQCPSCPWFELICFGETIARTWKSPKFAMGV